MQGQAPQRYTKCDFCKKPGHTEAECHFKQRLQGQRSQPQVSAHLASAPAPPPAIAPLTTAQSQADFTQFLQNAAPLDEKQQQQLNNQFQFVMALSAESPQIAKWVLDSGASCCATYAESDCVDATDCNITVTAAGSSFPVFRTGTALINTRDEMGRSVQLRMQNTLISPKFPCKLLALQLFTAKGHQVVMGKEQIRITSPATDFVFVGTKDPTTKLFLLHEAQEANTNNAQPLALLARTYGSGGNKTDMDLLWQLHLRHGHRNFSDIARQYGLTVPKEIPACTSCIMGKAHVYPHLSNGFDRATRVAEGFHSDFRGPFSVATLRGELYLLTIIDDFSRRIFGFLVKSQAEWFEIWSKFVVRVEAEIGRANCISWLLSDNGAVYTSGQMKSFCASKGIQQRFSAPYAQWMDHTAERNMRTIGEMSITTILHANLPKSAWGHAVLHAVQVINRTADNADTNKKAGFPTTFSRLEKWKGKELPGQTKGLYPLGCLAFKHIPAKIRASKLDAHATPTVYLGLDPNCRAYLLGSLFQLDLTTSVEVTFVENVFPFRKIKHRESPAALMWGTDNNLEEGDPRLGMFATPNEASGLPKALNRQALQAIGALPSRSDPEEEDLDDIAEPAATAPQAEQTIRRSSRLSQPPEALKVFEQIPWKDYPTHQSETTATILVALTETQLQTITPRTAEQALRSTSNEQWLAAMNREKQCHVKNGTFGEEWKSQATPPKSIPAGWVFKIKHRGDPIEETDLQPKQFKARVVIRGQYMREGLDFNDTFAPVAKPMTIRAVFALAAKYGCQLKGGDIETAFLTADMDCEVWVKMPAFWGRGDEPITGEYKDLVPRRLLKGVPGIPQGSKLFYDTFAAHLHSMGWSTSTADKCLFLNPNLNNELAAVVLWVDDFIFLHETEATWTTFIKQLCQRFTVPTLGVLTSFLGMSVTYNAAARLMCISQANTINTLVERAGMTDCNPVQTPCQVGIVWTKQDCPQVPDSAENITQYRALVALANFIANWTRPDITYTVNKLCKFMSNPGAVHWQALKHLVRYLKGTAGLGLTYNFSQAKMSSLGLHGYTDASYADCPDTSKSTIGYVFYFGGAILSWFSKLHTFVTTSTNHSEYAALAQGAKEAQWFVYLFDELEPKVKHTPMPLFVDNSGVISLVFNPIDHQANKHIRISCHFARELTEMKVIAPQRVASEKNLADIFTKCLPGVAFKAMVVSLVQAATTGPDVSSVRGEVLAHSQAAPSVQGSGRKLNSANSAPFRELL
jgi:transposase InsO family protein